MGKNAKSTRGQRRDEQRQEARARKRALQGVAARNDQFKVFSPPPLTGMRLKVLLDSKLATVEEPGHLVIKDVDAAWALDPWLWTLGTIEGQKKMLGDNAPMAVYVSRDYQVSIFDVKHPGLGWPKMWHLSLKRRDRKPIDDNRWRILQQIKNTLVGEENEAVELYPAESRLVDSANQYHMHIFADPEERWPFGFTERFVTSTESHGSMQRPLPPGTKETPDDVFIQGMNKALGEDLA